MTKLNREKCGDGLQVIAHTMMHLLEQSRGDFQSPPGILIERCVLDRNRCGVRKGLQESKLVLRKFGVRRHAQTERAERLASRAKRQAEEPARSIDIIHIDGTSRPGPHDLADHLVASGLVDDIFGSSRSVANGGRFSRIAGPSREAKDGSGLDIEERDRLLGDEA